ncbi:MAG: InlB B-repeat-containing protein [Paludibacteraceae bacterium]|nr:InlB B-repeat-containing protein [Paludibacteraceae bacterium]
MKKIITVFLTLMLVAATVQVQATDYVFRKKWDKSLNAGALTNTYCNADGGFAISKSPVNTYLWFNTRGYGTGADGTGTISPVRGGACSAGHVYSDGRNYYRMPMDIGGGIATDSRGYIWMCNASNSASNTVRILRSDAANATWTFNEIKVISGQSGTDSRVGYGLDVNLNSLGTGFMLITVSNAETGVLYIPVTKDVLGSATKISISGLGLNVRVRIVDATHFWIDGSDCPPKLVTVSSWSTGGITIRNFPSFSGGPNAGVRADVADFTFQDKRFLCMGTDIYNTGTPVGYSAKVFQLLDASVSPLSVSSPIGNGILGPLGTSTTMATSVTPHIVSCGAYVVENSTDRNLVHLYVSASSNGAMAYYMEEAPAFNIVGTNGIATSETVMIKTESATTGTLHFTYLLEEASADNPTFTIKHKNVQNADWHDNNKLGATNLTNVTCTNCTRSGTTFTVPSTGLGKAGKSLKITVTYTDDLNNSTPTKVYAVKCEEVPYRITYDSKGGSNIDPQDYEVTTNLTLASSPTKFGYTFSGWKVSATKGNWTAATVYTASHNVGTGKYGFVTLEAQWTANPHTVSVNPNGGVYNSSSSVTTHTGSYGGTQAIADATRTGYRFGGWLWTKEAYAATWAEVFYHYSNGYANLFSSSDSLASNSVNDVNKLSLLNILDKLKYDDSKYEFLLEYYSFTGYNRWTQTSNPATSDVSTVTDYNAVDTSWTAEGWRGLAVSNHTSNTFIDGSVNPANNWFYAIGCYNYWNNGIPACSSTDPEKVNSHLWVRTSSDLSNIGTRLSAALSSDALTSDNKYIYRNEDITIKAVWMPNHYTITYNGNGATGGSTASSSHIYDVAKALTTNGFTYGDYTFVGWSTSAGGDVLYTDGQSVSNLTPTHGGTVTLYAKWAKAYRLYSDGTTDFSSNALSFEGYFSLYHPTGNTLKLQVMDEHNAWKTLPQTVTSSVSGTVVQAQFTYDTKTLGTVAKYTGNFYVRADATTGGWSDYLNVYKDNKMGQLSANKYYWAKQIPLGAGETLSVKAQIGNIYNPCISDTMFKSTDLTNTSAIRYNYDRSTNVLTAYQAKGKTTKIGDLSATIAENMTDTFVVASFINNSSLTSTADVTGFNTLNVTLSNSSVAGQRVRIVHNFYTDSIIYQSMPNNVSAEIDAVGDLVISATDASTQELSKPFSITNGRVIYERVFSNNKIWYWISFPYDVKIADVKGIPHYGTAWIVKYYNTQKRANLTGNLATYWEYLPETATLNANEGYLLGFDNSYPMPVTLQFFSTVYTDKETINTDNKQVTLSNYVGTHADSVFDGNWHLVGTPVYLKSKVSGPNYIVTMKANNTGYIYSNQASATDLNPFNSFFVQYSGTETFTKQTAQSVPLMSTKATDEADEFYTLVMSNGTYTEKAGIILADDGKNDVYEQNKDLLLMAPLGSAYPQLFTYGASNRKMAFNHLAKATQTTVAVGLYVGTAAEYTFSLENKEVPALSVILRDNLRETETNLLYNNYTFDATTGTTSNRFELIINRAQKLITSVSNTANNNLQFVQQNGVLTISGAETGTTVRLFDMAGRCIYVGKAETTITIPALSNGIYTAMVGTQAHKIVIK